MDANGYSACVARNGEFNCERPEARSQLISLSPASYYAKPPRLDRANRRSRVQRAAENRWRLIPLSLPPSSSAIFHEVTLIAQYYACIIALMPSTVPIAEHRAPTIREIERGKETRPRPRPRPRTFQNAQALSFFTRGVGWLFFFKFRPPDHVRT